MSANIIVISAAKILEASGCLYEIKTPEGKTLTSNYKKEKIQWNPELFLEIADTVEAEDELIFNVSQYNPREIQSFWSVAVTKAKKAWGDKAYHTSFNKDQGTITLQRINP